MISSWLVVLNGLGATMRSPFGSLANARSAGSISAALRKPAVLRDDGAAVKVVDREEIHQRQRGRGLRAVEQRETFFRGEREAASPARFSPSSADRISPGHSTSPTPNNTVDRCASGARSPLAPTEPFAGTRGIRRRCRASRARR